MIVSFADKETELIFNENQSKKLPYEIQNRALVKLMLLNSAETEADLRIPPSNKLEKLKGNLKSFWFIRINNQWRIIFKFESGKASEVKITDYH